MRQPDSRHSDPILVVDRFPELLDALLALLSDLSDDEWLASTACAPWTVKDVALHLWGGDVGILSRGRDGFRPAGVAVAGWEDLVAFINTLNEEWLAATRRMSPRLLCDLLRVTGPQVHDYFASLDPYALGNPVSWAGPAPAPVWLDLAREYTERWHHQQHIRDAVGRPGLTEPRYLTPVLETFVRALPHTYRTLDAGEGTHFRLTITGEAGGRWTLLREEGAWRLVHEAPHSPQAELELPANVAWRLFTKGLTPEQARDQAALRGDERLAAQALNMVSIIA